jgi:hypothetical protein
MGLHAPGAGFCGREPSNQGSLSLFLLASGYSSGFVLNKLRFAGFLAGFALQIQFTLLEILD